MNSEIRRWATVVRAQAVTGAQAPTRSVGRHRWRPSRRRMPHVDVILIALTLLAFAIASYRLGAKSFWLDETVAGSYARMSWGHLWTVVSKSDPNMGLYYVLLRLWVIVVGHSDAAVRSLSVVLGGLSVPAIVLLGRRLFGPLAGGLAGLLLAISPFLVEYEQTARAYSLVVLLVTLSSLFFVIALEDPSPKALSAYAATSALSVYAHYFAAFVLLVQFLTVVAVRRRSALSPGWVLAWCGIVLLCIPEAIFAQRAGTGGISWIPEPTIRSLFELPSRLVGGRVTAVLVAVLACYAIARTRGLRAQVWRIGFVLAWLIVPVALTFVISRLGRPLFIPYYLIIVLPAIYLLAAAGLSRLPWRWIAAAATVAVAALSLAHVRSWDDQPSLENFRDATHYIVTHQQAGDGIIFYPHWAASGVDYYETSFHAAGPSPVPYAARAQAAARYSRVWLVIRDADVPVAERDQVERSLAADYRQITSSPQFSGVTVALYRPKPLR